MNKQKNTLEMKPMELVSDLMNVEGHPFSNVKFFNQVTDLIGGKRTFEQFSGGKVYKYMNLNFMANVDYQRSIVRKMEAMGLNPESFQAEEHKWMKRYFHNGKLTTLGFHEADADLPMHERRWYLTLYIISGQVFETTYYDGSFQPIPNEVIKPLLRDKSSKKQADAGLVGDAQVYYRNFKIESVRELSYNGKVVSVVSE